MQFPSIKSIFSGSSAKAATTLSSAQNEKQRRYLEWVEKARSRTRQHIGTWNNAQNLATAEDPKNWSLQQILSDICLDALLTSQMENRKQQTLSRNFNLVNENGDPDEVQTKVLKGLTAYRKLTELKLDSIFFGYNVGELSIVPLDKGIDVAVMAIPRTNIVPQKGLFFKDYSEDTSIKYREMPEYGTYILEYNTTGFGLLNKAVPHVLFKRFATSCWSELCEIYGIPPRVLKTNTQDSSMLNRGLAMLKDMGAAAYFVIDTEEELEWASGSTTDGAVYKNLIGHCGNELSLLISGAIIGQDTKNGNRAKDEVAQNVLAQLSQSDMSMLEDYWNTITLPALVKLGVLKGNLRFKFDQAQNLNQLWTMTKEALPFFDVDQDWMKSRFGIEVTGAKANATPNQEKLSASDFFV